MGAFRFFLLGDVEDKYSIRISIRNGLDLLAWLGFDADTWGAHPAFEVAARCRRRLWPGPRNIDPAIQEKIETSPSGEVRLLQLGREEGYLRKRTEELLAIAYAGGEGGQVLYHTNEAVSPQVVLQTMHSFLDRARQE